MWLCILFISLKMLKFFSSGIILVKTQSSYFSSAFSCQHVLIHQLQSQVCVYESKDQFCRMKDSIEFAYILLWMHTVCSLVLITTCNLNLDCFWDCIIHLFYNPLLLLMPNHYVKFFCRVAFLGYLFGFFVCWIMFVCDDLQISMAYFFFSVWLSFNYTVSVPSTITSMPLFSPFYPDKQKKFFWWCKCSILLTNQIFTNLLFFLNSNYLISYFLVFLWHSSHFLSFSHICLFLSKS